MEEFNEKRMFERFNMHCTGRIKKDKEEIAIQITNMSGQGLGFRTNKFLEDHERISIHLEVKNMQEPLVVTGEVTRTEVIDRDTFEVGFKLDMTSWMKMSKVLLDP